MKTCTTLEEAQALENVIHIHRVADDQWQAYEAGDTLPAYLTDGLTDEERAARA